MGSFCLGFRVLLEVPTRPYGFVLGFKGSFKALNQGSFQGSLEYYRAFRA